MRAKSLGAFAAAVVLMAAFVSPVTAASTGQVGEKLFNKINNKRERLHNLDRLKEWDVIVDEATQHSEYQAQQGDISHDGFSARANRIMNQGSGINNVCENVAFVSGVNDLRTIVRTFYRGWDKSPPHHACLFDEDFRATWAGVGIAKAGVSTWYATFIAASDSSPGQP
jgi:uncharacterized protein YkwD